MLFCCGTKFWANYITTSAAVTLNDGLVWGIPPNKSPDHSGLGIILICPENWNLTPSLVTQFLFFKPASGISSWIFFTSTFLPCFLGETTMKPSPNVTSCNCRVLKGGGVQGEGVTKTLRISREDWGTFREDRED